MYINSISVYSNKMHNRYMLSKPVKSQNFTGIKGGIAGGVTGLVLSLGIFANSGVDIKNTAPTVVTAAALGILCGSKMEDNDNDNNDSGKRMRRL